MKLRRLDKNHYDELIGLLNYVFSRKNKREMDFEKEIPKMCVRDDEHMGKHFGIFEEDKLVACIGVYPFDVVVANQTLRFATMGNIAVHPDYEGKGYMGEMIERAMEEIESLNIDVVRLGGLRSRYNRYGFEDCGQNFTFTFTEKNRIRKFPEFKNNISFRKIEADDKDALAFATQLYNKNAIAVPRTSENIYLSLTMWLNTPYLAIRNDKPIGYICADGDKTNIVEFNTISNDDMIDMICAWQEFVGKNILFERQMHQVDSIRVFSAVCENYSSASPSYFKIINWAKTVDAFLKLKATYFPVMQGELKIGIEGYGTIRIFADDGKTGCEVCDKKGDINLDVLSASRYIFGKYSPVYTYDAPPVAQSWFPLPLSWNGQDRV